MTWTIKSRTGSYFEVGTWGTPVLAALSNSLAFLNDYGVARIHEHNRALAVRILKELPRHGYLALTPESSVGSIVSFVVKDPEGTARRLARAKVDVGFQGARMRISLSVYNNDQDVDTLLSALT